MATLDEALAWGRARAPRVLVRYHQAGAYLWAGDGPPPPGLLPLADSDGDKAVTGSGRTSGRPERGAPALAGQGAL